ncbi:MAG TPA: hypothetical protein PLY88_05505 [Candidatus Omnitrophota bacterium]|nr:hypothetical protein [Candidatus Omnitrophota bacterium]
MRKLAILVTVLMLAIIGVAAFSLVGFNKDRYNPELLGRKNALEKEGRAFEKDGNLNAALAKFEQAIELDRKIYGGAAGRPMAFSVRVYQKKEDYETALKLIQQLQKSHPQHGVYIDWEKELLALMSFEKTQSPQPIHDFLNYYEKKNAEQLPPVAYYSVGSNAIVSTVFRLYDTIGDYDAGIAFVNECLNFFKKADIEKKGVYEPGRVDNEFLKIREAFEQDKAEGKKGCVGKKPGELCLGRATQALIQSDYFPW